MVRQKEGPEGYAAALGCQAKHPESVHEKQCTAAVDNPGRVGIDSRSFPHRPYAENSNLRSSDSLGDETVQGSLWHRCLAQLEAELPESQFNTWIRPLQAVEDGEVLRLLAPNRFVVDWVNDNVVGRISELIDTAGPRPVPSIVLEVGSRSLAEPTATVTTVNGSSRVAVKEILGSRLNPDFTFANFVEGKSNQLARRSGVSGREQPRPGLQPAVYLRRRRAGKDPSDARRRQRDPRAQRSRARRVRALGTVRQRHGEGAAAQPINEFKTAYRSLDALLIDDIQFFAGKDRSQEEFFHTFNALFEGQQQIILTCDRYPKEVDGLEERLKSRFGWGLTVAIEPPDLETCVAILMSKAAVSRRGSAGRGGLFHREAHPLERSRARGCAASRRRELAVHGTARSPWNSPRRRCATCLRSRTGSSPSTTSRRPSRITTKYASPTYSRNGASGLWRVLGKWQWRSLEGADESQPPRDR